MAAFRYPRVSASDITPRSVWLDRRRFIAAAGAAAAVSLIGGRASHAAPLAATPGPYPIDEEPTAFKDVTSYNNFYEFGTGKGDPMKNSGDFKPEPWTMEVGGMVAKPKTFDLDALRGFPLEDRTYRMRCVEGWSMVIPWVGFPLSTILDQVEPLGSAKFVHFETVVRPEEMPGQRGIFQSMSWPYVEGLRLDEARHPLTILAVGLYGQTLPNQNGAPVRLVVPGWGGTASIKWLTEINVTDRQVWCRLNTKGEVYLGDAYERPEFSADDMFVDVTPDDIQGPMVTWMPPQSTLTVPLVIEHSPNMPANYPLERGELPTLEAGLQTMRGYAWAPRYGVRDVEYRVDGGPWQPARLLEPNLGRYTWVRFEFPWDAPTGEHEIETRVTDRSGYRQPDMQPPNLLGMANGTIPRFRISVV